MLNYILLKFPEKSFPREIFNKPLTMVIVNNQNSDLMHSY